MGQLLSNPITSKHLLAAGSEYYRVGFAEMQGYRVHMEDAHNCILSLPDHPNVAMFGIYDGHSGPACSEYAAKELPLLINKLADPLDPIEVQKVILKLDADFCKLDDSVRYHGSTACIILIRPIFSPSATEKSPTPIEYHITIANVGDSRALILAHDYSIRFATTDHKPGDDMERTRIVEAGGSVSFGRVDGDLAMSRSLGDYGYKDQQRLSPEKQKVTAVSDVHTMKCAPGESMVLCCDGLLEKCSNEQLIAHYELQCQQPSLQPYDHSSKLIDYSLVRGSRDNMSVLCIELKNGANDPPVDRYEGGALTDIMASDRQFSEAYVAFASRFGIDAVDALAQGKTAAYK